MVLLIPSWFQVGLNNNANIWYNQGVPQSNMSHFRANGLLPRKALSICQHCTTENWENPVSWWKQRVRICSKQRKNRGSISNSAHSSVIVSEHFFPSTHVSSEQASKTGFWNIRVTALKTSSTVTRSSRRPLGCGGTYKSHHGGTAQKSATTACRRHVRMDQNL